MNNNNLDKLATLFDRVESLESGLQLPGIDAIHIAQMRSILPEIAAEIKEIYFAEGGEDVW